MGTLCTLRNEQMSHISAPIIEDFITSQFAAWPSAKNNFEALSDVKVKTLYVDGMHIKVQFNPARIVSSGAKVDKQTLAQRRCFLCASNRPVEQIGIPWGGHYEILINPFPIFPRHLTIPDTDHTDQLIAGRFDDMFRLADQLDGYTVFYNGPRCGASAPDHMHFQAGNSDFLTIAEDVKNDKLQTIAADGNSILSYSADLPLKFFVIDAFDADAAQRLFDRLTAAMTINEGELEPMFNILCYKQTPSVRAIIIPRKRHRPSFYGAEGEDTMLLSPASVDMGGVFITPLEKDFNRLDADLVRKVYDELCLNTNEITQIASNVKSN